MILRKENYIEQRGGFIPIITPDGEIALKFRTRGTCFPARSDGYTARACYFQIFSQYEVQNTVYIDYNDGTGEHVYNIGDGVGTEMIRFYCTGSTDPNQVSGYKDYDVQPNDGNGGGEFGLHFYQDLEDTEKINTVDHAYPQERNIYIRFENPQNIEQLLFSNVVLLGEFPSVAKLRNLKKFYLYYLLTLSSFNNESVYTLMEEVSLADLGISSNTLPLWVKNSPVKDLNIDSYLVTSTTQEFETEIVTPFKDTLEFLSMGGVPIDYALPESFSELTRLETLVMRECINAENFTFPTDLSTLTVFKQLDIQDSITFPLTEVKRFIQEVPTTDKSLNIRRLGINFDSIDLILDEDDYSVTYLLASYGRWKAGEPPTCIGQMKSLRTLLISGIYNLNVAGNPYSLLSWGNFSGATALEEINFNWQHKMDLTFPAWLNALTSLKTFSCMASFETQQAMDNFVDSVYSFIVSNASLAEGNTPFRYMNIIAYNNNRPLYSWAPSGMYQEPEGYMQNSSNGTPTTPMEKMYCLINNYNHSWNVKST